MLKILRRKGVSKVILWFLAVIIILAFGVFGSVYQMESKAERKYKYAGKVFGRKVSMKEFETQYQQTMIVDKINYGNNYLRVKTLLDQDRVQRTWVRLILLREAEKRGIRITDDDVVKFIQVYPPFQVDGRFNPMLYKDILQNFLHVPARTFEECLRDKLKIDKITQQETAMVTVSDEELKEAHKKANEKVQVSYLLFNSDTFKTAVTADEAEIKKYFEAHKMEFEIPPMVNVEYLQFDFPPVIPPAVKPGDDKSKESPTLSEADKDATWDKAFKAYQQIKKDNDFKTFVEQNNLKVAESGFFSMEQPTLKAGWSFAEIKKIFDMKPGDISEPIETEQGFQILRIKAFKPATMPELAEIKERVTDAWKSIEAAKLAGAKAKDVLTKLNESVAVKGFDFTKFAKTFNLEIEQTPLFRHGDYLPKLGLAADFQDQAFSLSSDHPWSTQIVETEKGFCILRLDHREEADMKDFEKEKDKYAKALLLDKKTKTFNDFLTHLRTKADIQDYLPKQQANDE